MSSGAGDTVAAVLLAAVAAQGETVLRGAAREPEVVDLIQFLTACGAQDRGDGDRGAEDPRGAAPSTAASTR